MKEKIWTIANIISLIRLILVPVFIVLFLQKHILVAFLLMIFMTISDYIDGYLARKLNQQSKLGAILDPLSDRALILSMYFCGGIINIIPFYFFILILLRDIVVGIKMLITKKVFSVNFAGKFGSFALMACGVSFILASLLSGITNNIFQGIGFATGIWGIYMYYIAGINYMKKS
jgi:cardiolipin synthase